MFTKDEVLQEARRQYGKPVCADMIQDAMQEPTLQDAVNVILIDSQYWGGPCY